jgi:hypothetical protein
MKRLIITDLHGKNPSELIGKLEKEQGITQGMCLGDIESPEISEYLLGLGERMVVLPGNHDFPYMIDCCKLVKGREVDRTGVLDFLPCDSEKYWENVEKWRDSELLRNFALRIVNDFENDDRFQYEFHTSAGKAIGIHASIFEDEPLFELPEELGEYAPRKLWARMHSLLERKNNGVITGNFEIMKDPYAEIWGLFRGHDWGQKIYSIERDSPRLSDYKTLSNPLAQKQKIRLSKDFCYIITNGSYQQGQYSIFDDETLELEFFNLERRLSWGI